MATLGYIQDASGWAILGIRTAVNIAGSMLGADLFDAAANIYSGQGNFWDYVELLKIEYQTKAEQAMKQPFSQRLGYPGGFSW